MFENTFGWFPTLLMYLGNFFLNFNHYWNLVIKLVVKLQFYIIEIVFFYVEMDLVLEKSLLYFKYAISTTDICDICNASNSSKFLTKL
jgi:hypothetical protein